jgi:excisionase family DNA binding protein
MVELATEYMTTADAARRLGVCERTAVNMANDGRLVVARVPYGRYSMRLYERASVERVARDRAAAAARAGV